MTKARAILQIFPDAERVEQALVEAAAASRLVDASAYLTFAQLVDCCEGAKHLRRRPCTPLTARVVLWALARRVRPGPFRSFVEEPAFARAALELIFELKAGALGPREFSQAVEALPSGRRARGRFLAELYAAYEQRMSELTLADREDVLRGAAERVAQQGLPPSIARFEALEIRGVYDFSPLRLSFVLALAEQAQRAGLGFTLEVPASGEPALDAAVEGVFRAFEARWERLEVDVRKELYDDRPLAAHARRLLAPGGAAPERGLIDSSSGHLTAFSAPGPLQEARQLASRTRELIDRGAAPETLAIAFRDLGEEADLLAEALDELGIPSRVRLGAPLLSTTVGRLALELPLLVEDGFPAPRAARFLESRYTPEVSRGGPASVGSLLALASVRDDRIGAQPGKGAYQVRLEALRARLENTHQHEVARAVGQLLSKSARLIAIGSAIPEEAPASKLLEAWWRSVAELGLHQAVRRGEGREAEGTPLGRSVLRALARDQAAAEALQELAGELDAALKLSGAGGRTMPRRTFHRWLIDAARDFNIAPKGPRAGAVRILDVRELAGSRFAQVLIGGWVDGRFPGRERPHPVFPDEDRAWVNRWARREVFRLSAGELEGRLPWRVAEDRLLMYLALCASTGTTTLSFARHGPTGQEQLRSPFLDELARATGLEVQALPIRPVPPLDQVHTERELRERVALEVFARPELRSTEPDPARPLLAERFRAEPWFGLARQLTAIEEERLRFFSRVDQPVGPFTGGVLEPARAELLARAFLFDADRPLSASALRRFGNCAFQGFLAQGLGLEEPEFPGEEMDSRGRGTFWHKVLELVFPRLRAAGLLERAPEELPDELINQALEEAAAEVERRDHVGHPALWKLGRERARAMVRRVLSAEHRGLPFEGHLPSGAEIVFGRPHAPEGWQTVVLPPGGQGEIPVHLTGKIDRLDEAPSGVGVIDYKSSRHQSPKARYDELLETEFQLPMYLYAARGSGAGRELRAAWLSLRDGKVLQFDEVLAQASQTVDELLATDPEARQRLKQEERKNLANAVHELVTGLRAGRFPARPEDCRGCAYRAVCRITQRRFQENGDG